MTFGPGQQLNIQPCENGYIVQHGTMFGTRALIARDVDDLMFTIRNIVTNELTPVPPDFSGSLLDDREKARAESIAMLGQKATQKAWSEHQLLLMGKWRDMKADG